MVRTPGGSFLSLVVVGALASVEGAAAQEAPPTTNRPGGPASAPSAGTAEPERSNLVRAEGMVMLDYQVIPVPGDQAIDLVGFHVFNRMTDWLYVGIGGFAPLFKGEYGGFMAYDVAAHAQRRIWGNLFANAGLSVGGGGGGKSVEQSKVLSGTGGFVKGYVGLGYDFPGLSVGANVARMKFKESAIDGTQLNVFVQVPFSYSIGPYASAGEKVSASDVTAFFADSSEYSLTWGLDNFSQIDPEGSYKGTVRVVDLQFAHYMTSSAYWYASFGVGYQGLPTYNQIIGGLGYRFRLSPRLDLHGQLGVGSGGYAPEKIDTGTGLLIYPKVSAEYWITRHFGLSLSAGYLVAPTGSSRNVTYGAALSYHIRPDREGPNALDMPDGVSFRGHRFSLFSQTEYNVRFRGVDRTDINLASMQIDSIVSDHVYIPLQGAVAYNAYLGYPGYGEVLAGVGLQNGYGKGDRLQFFGQLLGGTNVHGPILKAGIGLNYGLSDQLAIYLSAGKTRATSSKDGSFQSDYAGLGITYRFSVPSW